MVWLDEGAPAGFVSFHMLVSVPVAPVSEGACLQLRGGADGHAVDQGPGDAVRAHPAGGLGRLPAPCHTGEDGRRDARAIPDLIVRDPTGDDPGQADAARGVAEQETILVPLRARLGSGSGR